MIQIRMVEASVRHQLYMCLLRNIKVLFIAMPASASSHSSDCDQWIHCLFLCAYSNRSLIETFVGWTVTMRRNYGTLNQHTTYPKWYAQSLCLVLFCCGLQPGNLAYFIDFGYWYNRLSSSEVSSKNTSAWITCIQWYNQNNTKQSKTKS